MQLCVNPKWFKKISVWTHVNIYELREDTCVHPGREIIFPTAVPDPQYILPIRL